MHDETGPPGRARKALLQLLAGADVRLHHPPEVEAEAAAAAAAHGIDHPDLTDLTHLPLVTIDEVHSKDLDQALFIERATEGGGGGEGEGGYVVWYALADAAWSVRPGTALWAEALRRGSSYYLPGVVAPMLPRILSEHIISLNEAVDRRALVFRMRLDARGVCVETQVLRARVHSRAKLDYDGVQAWMDARSALKTSDPAVAESLRLLREVGRLRMALADERGVVRFRRTSVSVSLEGARGMRFVAWTDPRNDVERYNEQISLLTNVEGARFLAGDAPEGLVQPIYRVHDAPLPARVARLRAAIEGLIEAHELGDDWRWGGEEPLAEYLQRLPTEGALGEVARVIHRQAIVSNGRALFTDTPGRHHGIGAEMYARFTAPMREIVGIFLHAEACEKLAGRPTPAPEGAPSDEEARDAIIEASMRARTLQRNLDKTANRLVLDQLFGEDVSRPVAERAVRAGLAMGLSRGKLHVQLDEPGIDVKIYLMYLRETYGELQSEGASVMRGGEPLVRVGDRVRLRVERRDTERDRWALTLVTDDS